MGSKEGRGPQTDKTPAAKSLYRSKTTFGIAFYQSNFSMGGGFASGWASGSKVCNCARCR
jgi:hypothetical protein